MTSKASCYESRPDSCSLIVSRQIQGYDEIVRPGRSAVRLSDDL